MAARSSRAKTHVFWSVQPMQVAGRRLQVARLRVKLHLRTSLAGQQTVAEWAWLDTGAPFSVIPRAMHQGEVRVHSWKRTRHDFGPATALQSHHPIFGPWVPPAGVELLVLGRRRSVDGFRVEGGVDVPQQRNDVGIAVADAADLEIVLVDVDDLEF